MVDWDLKVSLKLGKLEIDWFQDFDFDINNSM